MIFFGFYNNYIISYSKIQHYIILFDFYFHLFLYAELKSYKMIKRAALGQPFLGYLLLRIS